MWRTYLNYQKSINKRERKKGSLLFYFNWMLNFIFFRWQLFSDRGVGVALFSSDRSLKSAAKCKYLAFDSTFEVCPKTFRQLLTAHGLVWLL
jgi:hypothetical protein